MVLRYNKITQVSKDLFEKKFKYVNKVTTVSKVDGVELENSVQVNDDDFVLKNKFKFAVEDYGKFEGELDTNGKGKIEYKSKSYEGVLAKLRLKVDPAKDFETFLDLDYSQEQFRVAGNVTFQKNDLKVYANALAGQEAYWAGGEVSYESQKDKDKKWDGKVADYNVGFQYLGGDYTASLKTQNKFKKLQATFYYSKSDYELATQATYDTDAKKDEEYTITQVAQYKINDQVTTKVKADKDGVVEVAVVQKVKGLPLTVEAAAQFKNQGKKLKSKKFGFNFKLGKL